jgi:signal transduction histidine kinase
MRSDAQPFPPEFAAEHRVDIGLCIPLRTSRHEGLILALDIAGLSADHLPVADKVGEVVANAFERASLLASMQEAAAAKSRVAWARDLHDGAVQFLAGMGFKIAALRRSVDDPERVGQGLDDIAAELVRQQDEVRAMIDHLREPGRGRLDLCDHLRALAKRIESQWSIAIEVDCRTTVIEVATHFRYQVDQIVREAVSNAARHGSAGQVTATVMQDDGFLSLEIADDGSGFGFEDTLADAQLWTARSGPRSLHERVRSLGGTLAVASSPEGSRLYLKLPLRSDGT